MASVRWSAVFLICFAAFTVPKAGVAQQGVVTQADGATLRDGAKLQREATSAESEKMTTENPSEGAQADATGGSEARPGGCGCKAGIRALEMKKIRELKQEEAGGASG